MKKAGKIGIFVLYMALFFAFSSAVYSAIGSTFPPDVELKPGQSDRFKFEIQAVSHPNDVECSYNLDNKEDLFYAVFDRQGPVEIKAGGTFVVTGTVAVNETAEPGIRKRDIEVSCKDIIDSVGQSASAAFGVYRVSLNVNIVDERTRGNVYVVPAPKKPLLTGTMIAGIAAALIVLIILIAVIVLKKKKKQV